MSQILYKMKLRNQTFLLLFLLFSVSLANETNPISTSKYEDMELMRREKHTLAKYWKSQHVVGFIGTILNCTGFSNCLILNPIFVGCQNIT